MPILAVVLLVAQASVVHGQTSGQLTELNLNKLKEAAQEFVKHTASAPGENRDKSPDQLKLRWLAMYERIQRAVLNQENLIGRIDSRIAKLKAQGKDTTKAEQVLKEAKTNLEQLKKDLAALDKKAKGIDQSTDQRQSIQSLIPDVKKIKLELSEVHTLLRSTLPLLKGLESKASGLREATGSAKPVLPRRTQ